MKYYLSSKLRGQLLRQLVVFDRQDTFCVLPVCTMTSYVADEKDWEYYFGQDGILRKKICSALEMVGADSENVHFYNYILPEEKQKKIRLDEYTYVILPGGDAELGISRVQSSWLMEELRNYRGDIIAYSAGALMLLERYFLSPNYYYKEFSVHEGLGILHIPCSLEVHYDHSEQMRHYIQIARDVLSFPVLAMGNEGIVFYDDMTGEMCFSGDAQIYEQED